MGRREKDFVLPRRVNVFTVLFAVFLLVAWLFLLNDVTGIAAACCILAFFSFVLHRFIFTVELDKFSQDLQNCEALPVMQPKNRSVRAVYRLEEERRVAEQARQDLETFKAKALKVKKLYLELKPKYETACDELTVTKKEFLDFKDGYAEAQARVAALEGEMSYLQQNADSIKVELQKAKTDLMTLQEEYDIVTLQRDELQARVASLEQEVRKRETQRLERKEREAVKEAATKSGFLSCRDTLMKSLFAVKSEYQLELQVASVADVTNFGGFKTAELLHKYFGMLITLDTLNELQNFVDLFSIFFDILAVKLQENDVTFSSVGKHYLYGLLPRFKLYYSKNGTTTSEASVVFDAATLELIILQLSKAVGQNTFAKQQRSEMTPELREAVLRRDNYTCCKCGNSRYEEPNLLLEVDHILPIKAGGLTILDNLQTLCWRCNRSKSSKVE